MLMKTNKFVGNFDLKCLTFNCRYDILELPHKSNMAYFKGMYFV